MRRLINEVKAKAAADDVDLRETYRTQMLNSFGGLSGMFITALPTVVFVIVNTTSGLRPAVIAAIGAALVLTVYRMIRRQSVQQALSGLFGVLIAALVAARTGQARGYFLIGIWTSFLYAVPFAVSVLVRRPLVGLLWEFLDPTPSEDGDDTAWHRRRGLLGAYTIATLVATALFLSRGIVQATLYGHNATGWLAFARIAMGYPLFLVAVGIGWWVVRRARTRLTDALPEQALADPATVQPATVQPATRDVSADDGAVDRGLGLG